MALHVFIVIMFLGILKNVSYCRENHLKLITNGDGFALCTKNVNSLFRRSNGPECSR